MEAFNAATVGFVIGYGLGLWVISSAWLFLAWLIKPIRTKHRINYGIAAALATAIALTGSSHLGHALGALLALAMHWTFYRRSIKQLAHAVN